MSAGICGKRSGFEEIFGSPATSPSAKRSRCCSPIAAAAAADLSFGYEDKVSVLLQLFPSMDRKVVETVLNSHDHKVDDAIKSLHALCLGDGNAIKEQLNLDTMLPSNDTTTEVLSTPPDGMNAHTSEQIIVDGHKDSSDMMSRTGSSWVDVFVQEMMHASNWDDVRARAMRILQDFERNVLAHSTAVKEQEIALLKEQLQSLLKENQILKRAVTIQHERRLEHEERGKEVQQMKHTIGQYQEQVRTLEMNNYTLKVHLQRAQEASSIPSQFHPDIF